MLACVLLGCCYSLVVGSPFASATEEHERLKATNLLLVQQIDRLAGNYLETLSSESLSKRELDALQTWLLFDMHFVDLNSSDPMQAFEVATALRRLSFAKGITGKHEQARSHLERALQIFVQLEHDYPASISYRIDHASALLQFSQMLYNTGDSQGAIAQCQRAIAVLQADQTFATGEFDESVPELLDAAADLLAELGEKTRAVAISKQSAQLREVAQAKTSTSNLSELPRDAPQSSIH